MWFGLAYLAPWFLLAVALFSLLSRRLLPTIPWTGLTAIAVATPAAFSASAYIVEQGPSVAAMGFFMACVGSSLGLAIALVGLSITSTRYFPLPAVAVGLLQVGSHYAFLPPWGWEPWGVLFFIPGLVLVAVGIKLWRRYGLTAPAT